MKKPRGVKRLTPGHTASLRLSSQGHCLIFPPLDLPEAAGLGNGGIPKFRESPGSWVRA